MDDKSSLKGHSQVTWTIWILVGINHISGTAEAIVVKFCMHVDYDKSQLKLESSNFGTMYQILALGLTNPL